MAEKKRSKAKTTKSEEKILLKDTNINQYSKEDLIDMVNSTEGNDFKDKYPDATFDRRMAIYVLKNDHHLGYVTGTVIPCLLSKKEIYKILEKGTNRCPESDDSDIKKVTFDLNAESSKPSLTISKDTDERWIDFKKRHHIAKALVKAYPSIALELMMDMVENGKLDITFKG